MSNMKVIMENWRGYEAEVLNEVGGGSSRVDDFFLGTGEYQTDTPGEGMRALLGPDGQKMVQYLADNAPEWNYMHSKEDRDLLRDRIDAAEGNTETLFFLTQGEFDNFEDADDYLRAKWSHVLFDPQNPIDYVSLAGILLTGPVGLAARAAQAAHKLGKAQAALKIAQLSTKAPGIVFKAEAIDWGPAILQQVCGIRDTPGSSAAAEEGCNKKMYDKAARYVCHYKSPGDMSATGVSYESLDCGRFGPAPDESKGETYDMETLQRIPPPKENVYTIDPNCPSCHTGQNPEALEMTYDWEKHEYVSPAKSEYFPPGPDKDTAAWDSIVNYLNQPRETPAEELPALEASCPEGKIKDENGNCVPVEQL